MLQWYRYEFKLVLGAEKLNNILLCCRIFIEICDFVLNFCFGLVLIQHLLEECYLVKKEKKNRRKIQQTFYYNILMSVINTYRNKTLMEQFYYKVCILYYIYNTLKYMRHETMNYWTLNQKQIPELFIPIYFIF